MLRKLFVLIFRKDYFFEELISLSGFVWQFFLKENVGNLY
jgi:hypothetical protein